MPSPRESTTDEFLAQRAQELVWCTERHSEVLDFYIAFTNVIIIVRRLIRQAMDAVRLADPPPSPTMINCRNL